MDQMSKLLSKTLLRSWGGFGIWSTVEACGRYFGGEPVRLREAHGEGYEIFFDLLGRKLATNFVEGFNRLNIDILSVDDGARLVVPIPGFHFIWEPKGNLPFLAPRVPQLQPNSLGEIGEYVHIPAHQHSRRNYPSPH